MKALLILAIVVFGYLVYVLMKPWKILDMNTELLGVIATYIITVALAIPFGKYISKVFKGSVHF